MRPAEAKAKAAGYDVRVGRFPFMGNGKAIALGEPEGMVKTVFDTKTGELLGAHMVGAEVTEMIQSTEAGVKFSFPYGAGANYTILAPKLLAKKVCLATHAANITHNRRNLFKKHRAACPIK